MTADGWNVIHINGRQLYTDITLWWNQSNHLLIQLMKKFSEYRKVTRTNSVSSYFGNSIVTQNHCISNILNSQPTPQQSTFSTPIFVLT